MDHLAVARRCHSADRVGGFGDDDLVSLERRGARAREPDRTCTNHQNLHGNLSEPLRNIVLCKRGRCNRTGAAANEWIARALSECRGGTRLEDIPMLATN